METSGEIGERESVTIVMNLSHHTIIGEANEDFAVQARCIQVHSEPFTSRDCAVEAG